MNWPSQEEILVRDTHHVKETMKEEGNQPPRSHGQMRRSYGSDNDKTKKKKRDELSDAVNYDNAIGYIVRHHSRN